MAKVMTIANNEKWWQSRRIIGMISGAIFVILSLFGVNISAEVQSQILDVIMLVIQSVTGILSVVLPLWSKIFPKEQKGKTVAKAA